jgi:hypothetical protein
VAALSFLSVLISSCACTLELKHTESATNDNKRIEFFELTVHLRLFLILYNIDFQRYKIFRISKRGQKGGTNYEKKEV